MTTTAVAFAVFISQLTAVAPDTEAMFTASSSQYDYQVSYQNQLVDFTIANGQIRSDSVCQNTSAENKANCQVEAKALFAATCKTLIQTPAIQWQQKQRVDAFCNVRIDQPGHTANIQLVRTEKPSSAYLARQQCSELTLRAQRTGSGVHASQRDRACQKARALSKPRKTTTQLARN